MDLNGKIGTPIVSDFNMWEELNYSLETEQGIRHLVIRSNYEKVERGLIDHGNYTVYEDLTPFDTMTEDEIDAHFEKAGHWDAEPYLDTHGPLVGQLHVNLSNPEAFIWDGKADDLNLMQQAQLVEYLTITDFDPDVDFEDEAANTYFPPSPLRVRKVCSRTAALC